MSRNYAGELDVQMCTQSKEIANNIIPCGKEDQILILGTCRQSPSRMHAAWYALEEVRRLRRMRYRLFARSSRVLACVVHAMCVQTVTADGVSQWLQLGKLGPSRLEVAIFKTKILSTVVHSRIYRMQDIIMEVPLHTSYFVGLDCNL